MEILGYIYLTSLIIKLGIVTYFGIKFLMNYLKMKKQTSVVVYEM